MCEMWRPSAKVSGMRRVVPAKAQRSHLLPVKMQDAENAARKDSERYNWANVKGQLRWAHLRDGRSNQLNEMGWLSTMKKGSKSPGVTHWLNRLALALQSSVYVVSAYLLRCVLVLALGLSIPQEVVAADATFLAIMFATYAAIDFGAAMIVGYDGVWLQRAFWVSSLWSATLAIEQVCNFDLLQSFDVYANPAGETIILLALGWGIVECWRSAQR